MAEPGWLNQGRRLNGEFIKDIMTAKKEEEEIPKAKNDEFYLVVGNTPQVSETTDIYVKEVRVQNRIVEGEEVSLGRFN